MTRRTIYVEYAANLTGIIVPPLVVAVSVWAIRWAWRRG